MAGRTVVLGCGGARLRLGDVKVSSVLHAWVGTLPEVPGVNAFVTM